MSLYRTKQLPCNAGAFCQCWYKLVLNPWSVAWRESEVKYGCPSNVVEAAAYLIVLLYLDSAPYKRQRTPELNARDQEIWNLYTSGVHPNEIAMRVGVTPPRVYQIIHQKQNS